MAKVLACNDACTEDRLTVKQSDHDIPSPLTSWVRKVEDIAVVFNHVHFIGGLDGIDSQPLQGVLEFLSIGCSLVNYLLLSSLSPLCIFRLKQ